MGDVLERVEADRKKRTEEEDRRRKRVFIIATVVLYSVYFYTLWLLVDLDWPDSRGVYVVDIPPALEEHDPKAEEVCGDLEKLPSVGFMSSDEQLAWTKAEKEDVRCFLSYIYPQIATVFGSPHDEGRTLLLNKGGSQIAYYSGNHRIDFALSGKKDKFDMSDYKTRLLLTHEVVHSFHGTRLTRRLLEEAIVETVTEKFYPRRNNMVGYVHENYEYLRENSVFRTGDTEIYEMYRFVPMVEIKKLEYMDKKLYKKINEAIYTDAELSGGQQMLYVQLLQDLFEGEMIEGSTAGSYIENTFLSRDLRKEYCDELCAFVAGGVKEIRVYVLKDGTGSKTAQYPVSVKLYDFNDNLLMDEQTKTNVGNNEYNLVALPNTVYSLPQDRERYRLVATISDTDPEGYDDVTHELEYCPADGDGLSGMVIGAGRGSLQIVGQGMRVYTTVHRGCFYTPVLRDYTGELEMTFTDQNGEVHTRYALKVVKDYAVVIDATE